MTTPIIDPSTLTEEQRQTIRAIYNREEYENFDKKFTEECLLEALFGEEFLTQKEE